MIEPYAAICVSFSKSLYPLTIYLQLAKKGRQDEQAKRDANDRNISEYFAKGAGKVQAKPKVQPGAPVS